MILLSRKDRMDYVIERICDYYGITKTQLFKRRKKPDLVARKRMACKLVYEVADVPLVSLAPAIGAKSIYPLASSIREISEDLSEDTYGNKELKATYGALLKHIWI